MPKLKICGVKNEQNAREICTLNIDFLGLIFAKSPRQVDILTAQKISQIAHQNGKKTIAVFVDESLDFILKVIKITKIDGVQIHRKISKSEFEALKNLQILIWQVVSVGEVLPEIEDFGADLILFDTKGKFKGGNGVTFDWNLLLDFHGNFGLAGGIGLENITHAAALKPNLIDINSRVEDENGLKNIEKIKQILKELGR